MKQVINQYDKLTPDEVIITALEIMRPWALRKLRERELAEVKKPKVNKKEVCHA